MLFAKGLSSVQRRLFLFSSTTLYLQLVSIQSCQMVIFTFIAMILCTKLLVAAALMSAIYEENKDQDGFLYMTYSGENTFGSH